MENHHFEFVSQIATNSLTFFKKFYSRGRLPKATILDGNTQSTPYCAICLDDIRGGHSYRKLPECGHCFHSKCIDDWFKSHSTCPLCRSQVPQIISLNDNHAHQWNAFLRKVVALFQDFLRRICDPLTEEFASMLCRGVLV